MVVSSIAKWDWPLHWPQLVETLIIYLKEDNKCAIHGSLQCLEMLVSGDSFMEEHIPLLYDHIFPTLLDLFKNDTTSYDLRFGSIKILNSILNWLSELKHYSESSNNIIKSTISSWFYLLVHELDKTEAFSSIKQCILEILYTSINTFPKYFKEAIPVIFPSIWKSFIWCTSSWEKFNGEDIEIEKDIELYIISIIDLLDLIIDKKLSQNIFNEEYLNYLFVCATKLLQLTRFQIEDFYHDHDKFIMNEDSEGFGLSVRLSSCKLIENITKTYFPDSLMLLQKTVGSILEEFSQSNSWRLLEALLFCVGNTLENWTKTSEESYSGMVASDYFDVFGFINILKECTTTDSDIVRGRIFHCVSKLIPLIQDYSIIPVEFLNLSSEVIQIEAPLVTKIFACKCIISHLEYIKENDFSNIVISIFPHLFTLVQYLKEESLCEFLMIIGELVKLSPSIYIENEVQFLDLLWNTWINNNSDPILSSIIVDCIKNLSSIEGNQILNYFAPKILSQLQENMYHGLKGNLTILPILIQMLCASVINTKSPIPDIAINKLYPMLIEIILSSNDHEVILHGCKCIIAYLRSCREYLWSGNKEMNGIQLILRVIERCLNGSLDDDAVIYIGPLINKLISTFGNRLGDDIVISLLQSVMIRLESAKSKILQQKLLLIFIRLIAQDSVKTIDLISNFTSNTNGLSKFLSKWTVLHEEIYDSYNIKFSLVALTKLFENDSLNEIIVPGDLKISNSSHKHKSDIPLRLRIFIIVIRDHMLEINKNMGSDTSSDEEDEILNENFDDSEPIYQESADYYEQQEYTDYYDQLVQYSHENEYEEDIDPDIKNDEIYNMDLENFLRNWLINFKNSNEELFNYYFNLLSIIEKDHVRKVVNV